MHLAAIVGLDGVRFAAAATTPEEVTRALADYVACAGPSQLWEREAALVSDHVCHGRYREALDVYFAHVGQRWDAQWLTWSEVVSPADRVSQALERVECG